MLPAGKTSRGKVDLLSLVGIGFLVTSLVVAVSVTANPLKTLVFNSYARYSADALINQRERAAARGEGPACSGAGCLAPEIIANQTNQNNLNDPVAKAIIDTYNAAIDSTNPAAQEVALDKLKTINSAVYDQALAINTTNTAAKNAAIAAAQPVAKTSADCGVGYTAEDTVCRNNQTGEVVPYANIVLYRVVIGNIATSTQTAPTATADLTAAQTLCVATSGTSNCDSVDKVYQFSQTQLQTADPPLFQQAQTVIQGQNAVAAEQAAAAAEAAKAAQPATQPTNPTPLSQAEIVQQTGTGQTQVVPSTQTQPYTPPLTGVTSLEQQKITAAPPQLQAQPLSQISTPSQADLAAIANSYSPLSVPFDYTVAQEFGLSVNDPLVSEMAQDPTGSYVRVKNAETQFLNSCGNTSNCIATSHNILELASANHEPLMAEILYQNPTLTPQEAYTKSIKARADLLVFAGALVAAPTVISAAPAAATALYQGGALLLAPTSVAAFAAAENLYPILTSPVTQVAGNVLTTSFVAYTAYGAISGPNSQAYQNAQTLLMTNYLVSPGGVVQMIESTIQTVSGTARLGGYLTSQLVNNIFVKNPTSGLPPLPAGNTITLVWDETQQAFVLPGLEAAAGAATPAVAAETLPAASSIVRNLSTPENIAGDMLFAPQANQISTIQLSGQMLLANARAIAQQVFNQAVNGPIGNALFGNPLPSNLATGGTFAAPTVTTPLQNSLTQVDNVYGQLLATKNYLTRGSISDVLNPSEVPQVITDFLSTDINAIAAKEVAAPLTNTSTKVPNILKDAQGMSYDLALTTSAAPQPPTVPAANPPSATTQQIESLVSKVNSAIQRNIESGVPISGYRPEYGCMVGVCSLASDYVAAASPLYGLNPTEYQVQDLNIARGLTSQNSFRHAVTVVKDAKGDLYLIDTTFVQFVDPATGQIRQLGAVRNDGVTVTTGLTKDNPVANELLTNGYIKLTPETLNEYLRLTSAGSLQPSTDLGILSTPTGKFTVQMTPQQVAAIVPELLPPAPASLPATELQPTTLQNVWNNVKSFFGVTTISLELGPETAIPEQSLVIYPLKSDPNIEITVDTDTNTATLGLSPDGKVGQVSINGQALEPGVISTIKPKEPIIINGTTYTLSDLSATGGIPKLSEVVPPQGIITGAGQIISNAAGGLLAIISRPRVLAVTSGLMIITTLSNLVSPLPANISQRIITDLSNPTAIIQIVPPAAPPTGPFTPATKPQVTTDKNLIIASVLKDTTSNPPIFGLNMATQGNYSINHQIGKHGFTLDILHQLFDNYYSPSPNAFLAFGTLEGPNAGVASVLQLQSDMNNPNINNLGEMQMGYVLIGSGDYGAKLAGYDNLLASRKSPYYLTLAKQHWDANGKPIPVTPNQLNANQKRIYDFKETDIVPVDSQAGTDPEAALASGKYVGVIATKSINDIGRRLLLYKYDQAAGKQTFVGVALVGDAAKGADWTGQNDITGDVTKLQFRTQPLGFLKSDGVNTGLGIENGQQWGFDLPTNLYEYFGGTGGPAMNILAVDPDALPPSAPLSKVPPISLTTTGKAQPGTIVVNANIFTSAEDWVTNTWASIFAPKENLAPVLPPASNESPAFPEANPINSPQIVSESPAAKLITAADKYKAPTLTQVASIAPTIGEVKAYREDLGNNLCGPLSLQILKDAGLLPSSIDVNTLYFFNPAKEMYLLPRVFNPNEWDQINTIGTGVTLGSADYWAKNPLQRGDWVFSAGGSFGHMFVVSEIAADGKVYAVTNYVDTTLNPTGKKPDWNPIDRVLLWDPTNPGNPDAMFNRWTNPSDNPRYGSTGLNGFIIEKPKALLTVAQSPASNTGSAIVSAAEQKMASCVPGRGSFYNACAGELYNNKVLPSGKLPSVRITDWNPKFNSISDLYWCTQLVLEAAEQAGINLNKIYDVPGMYKDFLAKGVIIPESEITAENITQKVTPGMAAFIKPLGGRYSHVALVKDVRIVDAVDASGVKLTLIYVTVVQSNAGTIEDTYQLDSSGKLSIKLGGKTYVIDSFGDIENYGK